MFARLLFALWLMMSSATKPLTMTVAPLQSFAPATIRVRLHIERIPENRILMWQCEAPDGMMRHVEHQLDGEASMATFEDEWKSVAEGEYSCKAGIGRAGLDPIYATARFTVIGR